MLDRDEGYIGCRCWCSDDGLDWGERPCFRVTVSAGELWYLALVFVFEGGKDEVTYETLREPGNVLGFDLDAGDCRVGVIIGPRPCTVCGVCPRDKGRGTCARGPLPLPPTREGLGTTTEGVDR